MALLEGEAPRDPMLLFDRWFREATQAGALQPEAMTLATTGEEGPSARMVLFKGILDGNFLFYSSYASRKGRDLSHDRRAALVFYWSVTRHQVRVYGPVRKVGRAASLEYFASRPRGARISALASPQSKVANLRRGSRPFGLTARLASSTRSRLPKVVIRSVVAALNSQPPNSRSDHRASVPIPPSKGEAVPIATPAKANHSA